MLKDVVTVKPLAHHHLYLRFEDGVEGEVNIANLIKFTGVFALLENDEYFAQVYVNPDLGTVCWPNEADIDPDVLYSIVTGQPIPAFELA